jgi:hypothetical protein
VSVRILEEDLHRDSGAVVCAVVVLGMTRIMGWCSSRATAGDALILGARLP